MVRYRHNLNTSCMSCGGQVPLRVTKVTGESGPNSLHYQCPDCGEVIMYGGVSHDGHIRVDPGYLPDALRGPDELSFPSQMEPPWETVEAYWTDMLVCCAFHGKVVFGDEELYKFAQKLEERCDRST